MRIYTLMVNINKKRERLHSTIFIFFLWQFFLSCPQQRRHLTYTYKNKYVCILWTNPHPVCVVYTICSGTKTCIAFGAIVAGRERNAVHPHTKLRSNLYKRVKSVPDKRTHTRIRGEFLCEAYRWFAARPWKCTNFLNKYPRCVVCVLSTGGACVC